jgi:hypothetical protein
VIVVAFGSSPRRRQSEDNGETPSCSRAYPRSKSAIWSSLLAVVRKLVAAGGVGRDAQ